MNPPSPGVAEPSFPTPAAAWRPGCHGNCEVDAAAAAAYCAGKGEAAPEGRGKASSPRADAKDAALHSLGLRGFTAGPAQVCGLPGRTGLIKSSGTWAWGALNSRR